MSTERQIKSTIKNYLSDPDKEKALQAFIDSIPEMVHEINEIRKVKGSKIIEEELAKGNKDEADKHDPERMYRRQYTFFKPIDHNIGCRKAFKKKGNAGLMAYRAGVMKNYHYLKGKYPQIFEGTQENDKLIGKKGKLLRFINKIKSKIKWIT